MFPSTLCWRRRRRYITGRGITSERCRTPKAVLYRIRIDGKRQRPPPPPPPLLLPLLQRHPLRTIGIKESQSVFSDSYTNKYVKSAPISIFLLRLLLIKPEEEDHFQSCFFLFYYLPLNGKLMSFCISFFLFFLTYI